MTIQPSKASTTVTGEWECTECGYIEEGVETRRPAQCPECEAPAESLEFYAYEDDDWDEDGQEADMEELALLDADDDDLYKDDNLDEDFEDDEDAF